MHFLLMQVVRALGAKVAASARYHTFDVSQRQRRLKKKRRTSDGPPFEILRLKLLFQYDVWGDLRFDKRYDLTESVQNSAS